MIDRIRLELDHITYMCERLESNMRRLDMRTMELSKYSSVLNRKVELILDQQQTDSFLEEEVQKDKRRPGPTHQAVQSVPQANAQASKVV